MPSTKSHSIIAVTMGTALLLTPCICCRVLRVLARFYEPVLMHLVVAISCAEFVVTSRYR
ncbi:hypothetical protein BC832DRAFT_543761 [Gaertneriomyces semiglobifer]|nr:hypothetical protein BC832DRAFT_543761 [Gaertneriomyces semiglobifer]